MVDRRTLALDIEASGTMYLEHREDELLFYLAREMPLELDLDDVMQRALSLCHYRQGIPMPVYPALRGENRLVFLVKTPLRKADLPEFERILSLLRDLHAKAIGS